MVQKSDQFRLKSVDKTSAGLIACLQGKTGMNAPIVSESGKGGGEWSRFSN